MKFLFASLIFLFQLKMHKPLTGRWESIISKKGNVTGLTFKKDSILEGYINKKPFVSGVYQFNATDSILTFTDNGCNGVEAVYKILFFSYSDSLRFKVIRDSCIERSNGMQQLIMGRVNVYKDEVR